MKERININDVPAMHSILYDWGFCFTDEKTQAWKGKDLSQIETGSAGVETQSVKPQTQEFSLFVKLHTHIFTKKKINV